MREKGIVEGRWGIFSEKIPGRVGYQCSNFYRKLILDGVIKDSSYRIGPDGKLHYKDRGGYTKGKVHSAPRKKRTFVDEDDDPIVFQPGPSLSKYDMMAQENPIKGQIDFLTGEEIQVAAVSPSGTVLDYNTWMKILLDSREDPFTRQPVNKRQIVVLNHENFDQYRDRIRLS
jgi:hypothetical protein